MAMKRYDPLKSNRSSFGKRPKLTWSDKRSGDSVGKGLKRGSYKAWTAYHSSPKKYFKPVKSTRSSSSPKITRQRSVSGVSQSSEPSSLQSDIAVLREIAEIFKSSSAAEPSVEETSESTTPKGSEILSPEVLQALRDYDTYIRSGDSDEESELEPDDEEPIFGSDKPKNTDHCPYCGFVFPKAPKRGRACEQCGQKFVFRSRCALYNSTLLTLEESAANDCFIRVSHIRAPIKFAQQALSENPNLSPTELFIKMIEAYAAETPLRWLKDCGEDESWMYQSLAEYEEKCGRSGSAFRKLGAARKREYNKFIKIYEDASVGKIDIWK